MVAAAPSYPFGLDIDPPAPQSRLTIFFRYLLAIPLLLIFSYALVPLVYLLGFFARVVIVITGKLPGGIGSLILGAFHWWLRFLAT